MNRIWKALLSDIGDTSLFNYRPSSAALRQGSPLCLPFIHPASDQTWRNQCAERVLQIMKGSDLRDRIRETDAFNTYDTVFDRSKVPVISVTLTAGSASVAASYRVTESRRGLEEVTFHFGDDGKYISSTMWAAKDYVYGTSIAPVEIAPGVFISFNNVDGEPTGTAVIRRRPLFTPEQLWKSLSPHLPADLSAWTTDETLCSEYLHGKLCDKITAYVLAFTEKFTEDTH